MQVRSHVVAAFILMMLKQAVITSWAFNSNTEANECSCTTLCTLKHTHALIISDAQVTALGFCFWKWWPTVNSLFYNATMKHNAHRKKNTHRRMRCEECFHALFPVFWGMWVSVGSLKRIAAVLRVQLLLLETVWHVKITQRPPAHQYTSLYYITAWKKQNGQSEGLFKKNTLKKSICVCVYTYIYIYTVYMYIYTVSHRNEYTPHIFCKYLIIYFHVKTLKIWHFSKM